MTTKHVNSKYSNFKLPRLHQSPTDTLSGSQSGNKLSLNLSIQLHEDLDYLRQNPSLDINKAFKKTKRAGHLSSSNKIGLKQGISPYKQALDHAGIIPAQVAIEETKESMKNIESMRSILDPGNLNRTPGRQRVTDNVNQTEFQQPTPKRQRNRNVSYNLLSNDKERSKQLMNIFDKKLVKLG